jgi:hypothetical protein
MDERVYLKVKIKSLAEEARIIRKETKRARSYTIKKGLDDHRKGAVRYEARHTHLAYGFLRGREYYQIEHTARTTPNWDKVRKMVKSYGVHYPAEQFIRYKDAQKHLEETLERFDLWVKAANEQLQKKEAERSQNPILES